MKTTRDIVTILAVMAIGAVSATGQIKVSARAETGRDIYVGERFAYHIIIEGLDKPGKVDLQPLQKYYPQRGETRRQSYTNVNTGTSTTSTIMTYALTADRVGRVQLPPVTVEIDGKTYRTNPVSVNISKPGTTDRLDLEVTLSEQQCYVGQPIILTVKFYVSADISDFQFNIPALNNDAFEIVDPDVSDPQAKVYRLHTGMTVIVSQYRVEHNNLNSLLVTFSKILIPKRPGRIVIPSSSVSAAVAVGRVPGIFGSQTRYERFIVKSEPLELEVSPVPDEGKPAQFYGLIGQYTISASATPTQVNVGDPITLTVKIGGSKYLKPVQWPELDRVPELADNFKIPSQKASPIIEDGFKVFTQTIRANNDKVTRIPPIPLASFNVKEGKYLTAQTDPIELEVAPTKVLTSADLEGADFVPVNREIEAIKKGLSANYEDFDTLKNMSFSPLAALIHPGYAVLWAAPLIGFISSILIKLSTHTSPEKVTAKRQRQACGKAIGQLKKIASTDAKQQNELLMSIMKQYIGDRFDKTAGSLTPDDCYEAIEAATDDAHTAEKYREIITNFEAGRYASIEVHIDSKKVEEVADLIRSIDNNRIEFCQ
ncbi:BatD family protein [Planctomycetota bacterium]